MSLNHDIFKLKSPTITNVSQLYWWLPWEMCVWWQWLANTDYWQVWWPWQTSGNATTSAAMRASWQASGGSWLVSASGHGQILAGTWPQPVAIHWLCVCVCLCIQSSHVHNNTATDTAAACLVFVKSISDWYQQCFEKCLLTDEDYEASLWQKMSIQISIVTTLSSSGVSSIKNDIMFSHPTHIKSSLSHHSPQ